VATFVIDEVKDLDAVWPEVESLLIGLSDYSAELVGLPRVANWRELLRERAPSGPEAITLLARSGGLAVGLLSCVLVHNLLQYEETFAYVDAGFVLEPYRRTGATRALLARAEEWSRGLGIYQLRTTVHAVNTLGLVAWQGLGFSPSSHNLTKWLAPS